MNDMSTVIIPKSDQLNADDLIAGPRTITIAGVDIRPGTEQPVTVHYDGEDGRPWKPCKSMSRLMVAAWGPDANRYAGRSLTLYRDPNVKWGGMAIGGIRVSHMSDLPDDKVSSGRMVVQLTETRGKRSPCVVMPLVVEKTTPKPDKAAEGAKALLASITQADNLDALLGDAKVKQQREWLQKNRPDLASEIEAAIAERTAGNPFDEGRAPEHMGEGFTDNEELDRIRADLASCKSLDALDLLRAEFEALELPGDDRARVWAEFDRAQKVLERGA